MSRVDPAAAALMGAATRLLREGPHAGETTHACAERIARELNLAAPSPATMDVALALADQLRQAAEVMAAHAASPEFFQAGAREMLAVLGALSLARAIGVTVH